MSTLSLTTCQKACITATFQNSCNVAVPIQSVSWQSNDTAVCTVNAGSVTPGQTTSFNAIVTGVGPGSTTVQVTVTPTSGYGGSPYLASFPVTVTNDTTFSVSFSFGTPVLKTGSLTCGNLVGATFARPATLNSQEQTPAQREIVFQSVQTLPKEPTFMKYQKPGVDAVRAAQPVSPPITPKKSMNFYRPKAGTPVCASCNGQSA